MYRPFSSRAEVIEKQWESDVLDDDGGYVPVGARIAQELIEEGARLGSRAINSLRPSHPPL